MPYAAQPLSQLALKFRLGQRLFNLQSDRLAHLLAVNGDDEFVRAGCSDSSEYREPLRRFS